jgi:hypothetical protein
MARRSAIGSRPEATASSSRNELMTKPLIECSTERHQPRGTPDCASAKSVRKFGTSYGMSATPSVSLSPGFSVFGVKYASIDGAAIL